MREWDEIHKEELEYRGSTSCLRLLLPSTASRSGSDSGIEAGSNDDLKQGYAGKILGKSEDQFRTYPASLRTISYKRVGKKRSLFSRTKIPDTLWQLKRSVFGLAFVFQEGVATANGFL